MINIYNNWYLIADLFWVLPTINPWAMFQKSRDCMWKTKKKTKVKITIILTQDKIKLPNSTLLAEDRNPFLSRSLFLASCQYFLLWKFLAVYAESTTPTDRTSWIFSDYSMWFTFLLYVISSAQCYVVENGEILSDKKHLQMRHFSLSLSPFVTQNKLTLFSIHPSYAILSM